MAEIYQNPSLFSGGFLTPPDSLIPEAPKAQDDAWQMLLSLMQVLPRQVIEPIMADVLSGKLSASDIVQRFSQPNNQALQGGITQPGLSANNTIGNEPTSQYTTTTTQLPPANTPPAAPGQVNATPGNSSGNAFNPQSQPLFSYNNPFYSQVTSPLLNEQGQEVGQTNLANNQFATPGMTNSLLGYLSSTYGLNNGRVVEGQYSGPTRPSQSELGIQFGNSPVINAGLEYQRLQNTNNYSRPYLDAQFKDTLQPGSSGWNNYVNTGGQSINSAQAERLYAGNPATDPNVNPMGQAWKSAETRGAYSGPQTPTTPPAQSSPWRSLPGNNTMSGYASQMNQRRPMNTSFNRFRNF